MKFRLSGVLAALLALLCLSAQPAFAQTFYVMIDGTKHPINMATVFSGGNFHPKHVVEGLTAGGAPTALLVDSDGTLHVTGALTGAVTNAGTFAVQNTASIPAGGNDIGTFHIGGTLPAFASTPAFSISGSLPAYASTPTFNCGTGCASSSPWLPDNGSRQAVSPTGTAGTTTLTLGLSAGPTIYLKNYGTVAWHFRLGTSGSPPTSTTADDDIAPGACLPVARGSNDRVSIITDTGTGAAILVTGSGSPTPSICSDLNNPASMKLTDGTNTAAIKAATTAPTGSDPAVVVNLSPNPVTVCTSRIAISQTTSTDLKTSTAKLHICSIMLISATAQNLSLTEGTGTVCATGAAALIGGTTASVAVAANGGWSAISGIPWLKTQTTADHLCLLQSGSGNVSGIITYADAS